MEGETTNINTENDEKKDYHKMILLAIKIYYKDQVDKENDNYEIRTFHDIKEIVQRWISQQRIQGVINCYESNPKKNITNELSDQNT